MEADDWRKSTRVQVILSTPEIQIAEKAVGLKTSNEIALVKKEK